MIGTLESSACSENGRRIVLKPIRRTWPIMSSRSRDHSPWTTWALVSKPNQLTPCSTTVWPSRSTIFAPDVLNGGEITAACAVAASRSVRTTVASDARRSTPCTLFQFVEAIHDTHVYHQRFGHPAVRTSLPSSCTITTSSWEIPPVTGVPTTISIAITCPATIGSCWSAAMNGPSTVSPI